MQNSFLLRKSLFWHISTQWTPPSGWKATDLLFLMAKRKKKYSFRPVKRQIFGEASGKTSALILTRCHTVLIHCWGWNTSIIFQISFSLLTKSCQPGALIAMDIIPLIEVIDIGTVLASKSSSIVWLPRFPVGEDNTFASWFKNPISLRVTIGDAKPEFNVPRFKGELGQLKQLKVVLFEA